MYEIFPPVYPSWKTRAVEHRVAGKEVKEGAGKSILVDDELPQEMIELIFSLRSREVMSYRKIEQYLLENHGYAISYKSIERKLRAYTP